jgi:ribosomal protein S19E (S16A)
MNGTAVTGAEVGLSGDDQIRIALQAIADHGGVATMQQIYDAVSAHLTGTHLSDQGKASLRRLVNKVATDAGYIYKHNQNDPGWRITPEGQDLIAEPVSPVEEVINVDTQKFEPLSNTARGAAFELYTLNFLKRMHPYYTWYHQGRRKNNERGLDFIGDRVGDSHDEPRTIGVQVKFHPENTAPNQIDWLKFLAGCFSRRVDSSIFVTSGRLTSEQRREAGEARVTIIEGRREITRLAQLFGLDPFDLFDITDEIAD